MEEVFFFFGQYSCWYTWPTRYALITQFNKYHFLYRYSMQVFIVWLREGVGEE